VAFARVAGDDDVGAAGLLADRDGAFLRLLLAVDEDALGAHLDRATFLRGACGRARAGARSEAEPAPASQIHGGERTRDREHPERCQPPATLSAVQLLCDVFCELAHGSTIAAIPF